MKKQILAGIALSALVSTSQAGVTLSQTAVGSSTDFAATANGGSLFINTLNPGLGAGGTIAGGAAQGLPGSGSIVGETFYWTGGNSVLSAITFINTGGGGAGTYQPFLLDLGFSASSVYNNNSTTFAPNGFVNLLSSGLSIQPPATAQKQFEQLDFSGTDAVTLQTGHSYAFGFVIGGTVDFNFERAGGLHTYADGTSFVGASPGLSASGNVSVSPYSGTGSRDWLLGVYAAPVPEPGSLALLGLAAVTGGVLYRRRRSE